MTARTGLDDENSDSRPREAIFPIADDDWNVIKRFDFDRGGQSVMAQWSLFQEGNPR